MQRAFSPGLQPGGFILRHIVVIFHKYMYKAKYIEQNIIQHGVTE